METSGFYKYEEGGELQFAPNFVEGPGFGLYRETHAENTYPVEGWYWFEGEEEARVFFGIQD